MNTIVLLFRSKKLNSHSIENIFNMLKDEYALNFNVSAFYASEISSSFKCLIKNMLSVNKINDGIIHITGDIHYAALISTQKTVLTIHDCGFYFNAKGIKKFIFWLLWFFLPFIKYNKITAISESTIAEIAKIPFLPKREILLIENPCNSLFFTNKTALTNERVILHVGTKQNKNLEMVIESTKELNSHLIIIGKTSKYINEMLLRYKYSYENHINITNEALVNFYKRCRVVSFPSLYEGFGMPIVEGQAVGRIVVTSNLEPMRSVANGGAILVDPHSINSIRAGFEKAFTINNEEMLNLLEKGYANASKFKLNFIVSKYQKVYESLNS